MNECKINGLLSRRGVLCQPMNTLSHLCVARSTIRLARYCLEIARILYIFCHTCAVRAEINLLVVAIQADELP